MRETGYYGNAEVWGFCAYCGKPILYGQVYHDYQGDAICRECEKLYALEMFFELTTREVAK